MAILDARFGGEMVTEKGKKFKFDSVECMENFIQKNFQVNQKYTEYVSDSFHKGVLIEASNAQCLIVDGLSSPMGKGVLCSEQTDNFTKQGISVQKGFLKWNELKKMLGF